MEALGDTGFYCRQSIYYFGISCAEKKETVLARRILDGVIKPEIIAVSTLSGKAPRAQGRERQKIAVKILHPEAVAAIKSTMNVKVITTYPFTSKKYSYNNLLIFLEFAHEWAEKYANKGWTTSTEEQVKQSLRTRIVEIKAERNANLQKQTTE